MSMQLAELGGDASVLRAALEIKTANLGATHTFLAQMIVVVYAFLNNSHQEMGTLKTVRDVIECSKTDVTQ